MALTDSLVAYWKMDEASGSAIDAVDGTSTLTDNNSVGAAAGKINNGRAFTATSNHFFSHADSTDLSTGDISFEFTMWVKLTTEPGTMGILGQWTTGDLGYLVYYNADRFNWILGNGGSNFGNITADTFGALSTGTWYFIDVWYDSGANTTNIRINDSAQDTSGTLGTAPGDSSADFRIGQNDNSNYFDGVIDEVGFWKRLLTTEERTQLYNGGAGLAYPFDGSGAAIKVGSMLAMFQ